MEHSNIFGSSTIGWLQLSGAVSEISDGKNRRRLDWIREEKNCFLAQDQLGDFFLKIEKLPQGVRIRTEAVFKKPCPEHLIFSPLVFPAFTVDHAIFCGERMGGCVSTTFPLEQSRVFSGRHYAALTRQKDTVLISTPLKQKYDNFFRGHGVGEQLLNWRCDFEFCHNDLPERIEFDTITLQSGNGIEMLESYGRDNVETEKDFSGKPDCGWNSWDYYRWTITEDEVIKNAEFIAADPILSQHVKRIIVDDGWQYCYGEWEANPLFPGGMKNLAQRLLKMGFKPGLWIAPTIVEPHCRIAQWDYDMLALSEGGQPCLGYRCMERYGFLLDPTVPQTQQFMKDLFDRYAGMGYAYFKLDFLGSTMTAKRFHDRSVPRCGILRILMESICSGIAGRAEILGCNYHFLNGSSFVNAVRVGGDIHSHWHSIKSNTLSVAGMFWANKKLWINDPDFALCRGIGSSDDPDLRRLKPCLVSCRPDDAFSKRFDFDLASTTFEEQQVLLSLDIIAGGAVNLSDKMFLLNEKGLDLARKVVSAESGSDGRPLDLFERELPIYWSQKLKNGGRFLIINWNDETQEIPLDRLFSDRKVSVVRDFWTGKTEELPKTAVLLPHSCKLWEF